MIAANHTPGPWGIIFRDGLRSFFCDETGERLAVLFGKNYRANAHLMASAPDLLKALNGILEVASVRIDDPRIEQWNAARAAVAKATGSAL